MRRRDFIIGLAGATTAAPPLVPRAQPLDRTVQVERVGNPGRSTYPDSGKSLARNVWALKTFGERLYVGIGNRDNFGPAPNAGPVDIWCLDPKTSQFIKDWTAPDEQVEVFRIIDGQLVVPG